MTDRQKFSVLRGARRVWAIGAIHAEVDRLDRLHQALWDRLELCDRIVYLGNMIGRGAASRETVDSLLEFRIAVLGRPHSDVDDVVYLRGAQEEMWQKLLQLQFAADARNVLDWMIGQGVDATLRSYGISPEEALREASAGTVALTRWTGRLRQAVQAAAGHYELMGTLRRAAYTDDGALLFVNTGLDPTRPLEAQSDSFWWNSAAFSRMSEPYSSFQRVIRGYDPAHPGIACGSQTVTVDVGCGIGGPLLAACLDLSGEVVEALEA